ncbi:unnamed protein product, partial [marine sediment metagenome]
LIVSGLAAYDICVMRPVKSDISKLPNMNINDTTIVMVRILLIIFKVAPFPAQYGCNSSQYK